MGRDLELLAAGQPACRLYEWDGVWVTIGRFQRPEKDLVDLDAYPWIVRPTGGKAVLHGHDWTIGLAVPLAAIATQDWPIEKLSRSVRQVYRHVASPIIQALRACGLRAALGEETSFRGGPRVADCFAHISANDIVEEETGVKVCGCALKLTPGAVLVQASIPRAEPLVAPARVICDAGNVILANWQSDVFPEALNHFLQQAF